MKKLVFGLIAIIVFNSIGNAQSLDESVAFVSRSRVSTKTCETTRSARSVFAISFDSQYTLKPKYSINGSTFTDDGKGNDVKGGDGIYTSEDLYPNLEKTSEKQYVFYCDSFKYRDDFKKYIETTGNSNNILVGCRVRIVYTGTTILGFSCASGCLEFFDCYVELDISIF